MTPVPAYANAPRYATPAPRYAAPAYATPAPSYIAPAPAYASPAAPSTSDDYNAYTQSLHGGG